MKRISILLFGIAAYGVFFLTFLYLIAFVGNLQLTALSERLPWLTSVVPFSIDAGRTTGPVGLAVAINLGLIALFGLQHSLMARLGFKAWLKRTVPASAERSVFVLLASLFLILLFWQWRPLTQTIWAFDSAVGQTISWGVFALGFAIVLLSTFLIDHFDLFGLKQVWRQFTGTQAAAPRFVTPLFYRFVRHPLYLGFILAFWGGPSMTAGHLLFAAAMTGYILIAIQFEERDLGHFHNEYTGYKRQVPMLLPKFWRPYHAPDESDRAAFHQKP